MSLEPLVAALVEQYLKRRMVSRTPVEIQNEQGSELLRSSKLTGAALLEEVLGNMPDDQMFEGAARLLSETHNLNSTDESEKPVQRFVVKFFERLCFCSKSVKIWMEC